VTDAEPRPEEIDEDLSLVYVTFSAGVTQDTTEVLIDAMAQCANADAREVHLLLSTHGGNVTNGINLYNVLRGFPFKLVTHNAASVASIGVALYLAGEERLACPGSTFVLHGVTFEAYAGQLFDAAGLRERRESVLADEAKINAILGERTSLDAERLQRVAESEQTMGAEQAVEDGVAHRIEEIEIPPEAFVMALRFDR